MILSIRQTKQFKKDIKAARRQKKDITELDKIVSLLQCGEPLPEKYKDRALTGDLKYYRECHIKTDWLLVYMIENDILILTLSRTGSHSELFDI